MKRNPAKFGMLAMLLALAAFMPQMAAAANGSGAASAPNTNSTKAANSGAGKTHVVRVHGNAFVVEYPRMLLPDGIKLRGWGVNYLAYEGVSNWFHVPLPIYADDAKRGVQLKKIYLLFRTDKTIVTDVHVWDGARPVKSFTKLELSGDHGSQLDDVNQFAIDVPGPITSGLGISVGVTFKADGEANGRRAGEILLVGAGAVYEE